MNRKVNYYSISFIFVCSILVFLLFSRYSRKKLDNDDSRYSYTYARMNWVFHDLALHTKCWPDIVKFNKPRYMSNFLYIYWKTCDGGRSRIPEYLAFDKDGWGRPILIRSICYDTFEIRSLGPNGVEDNDFDGDDIFVTLLLGNKSNGITGYEFSPKWRHITELRDKKAQ